MTKRIHRKTLHKVAKRRKTLRRNAKRRKTLRRNARRKNTRKRKNTGGNGNLRIYPDWQSGIVVNEKEWANLRLSERGFVDAEEAPDGAKLGETVRDGFVS
jgi:hypothetical protein